MKIPSSLLGVGKKSILIGAGELVSPGSRLQGEFGRVKCSLPDGGRNFPGCAVCALTRGCASGCCGGQAASRGLPGVVWCAICGGRKSGFLENFKGCRESWGEGFISSGGTEKRKGNYANLVDSGFFSMFLCEWHDIYIVGNDSDWLDDSIENGLSFITYIKSGGIEVCIFALACEIYHSFTKQIQ